MKNWTIGVNQFYFDSAIYLEEAPWYIFLLRNLIPFICNLIPRIPLPKIKIKIKEDGSEPEETNLQEYYGTTWDLFHNFICVPLTGWCFDNIIYKSFSFPYDMLKKEYPEYFKDIDNYEDDEEYKKESEENLEYSKYVEGEFKKVYDKLENISSKKGF